jgi:hypothetical protein
MRRKILQLGVVLVAAGVLAGCKTAGPVHTKEHPDPLLHCHKPIEGKARETKPDSVVRIDPPPPPIPTEPGSAIVRQRAPLGMQQPLQAGLD